MLDINKFPVVIISNYRTGSSALLWHIKEKYDLIRFNEPHYTEANLVYLKETIRGKNNRYAVKFIADQIGDYDVYKQLLLRPGYKIKLTRNNKVDQITSYYIAHMTNRWRNYPYDQNPNLLDYEVPISEEGISFSINAITNADNILESLQINFDQVLTYEELGYLENDGNFTLTVQPRNFEEIRTEIEKRYKNSQTVST